MFKFCNLYSGSSGNCSFVETENTKVLIDCGISSKKLSEALSSINVDIFDIDAILITHEHSDHVKGLSVSSNKYRIPIYANSRTFDNLKQPIQEENKNLFKSNESFEIGDLKIHPFSIPHDAADPCGFSIIHNDKKISIATDIGHMNNSIFDNLVESSFVFLESNYEPDMLKCSKYPYVLKKRILGPYGHLSNEDAGNAISTLIEHGIDNIMLGHLSQHNNFPELAYKTVMESIIYKKINYGSLKLSVATREKPNDFVEIC